MTVLPSDAERFAELAEALPAFSGFKLLHVRQQLTKLLSLIGREGVFDEYTMHDVSHIDKMLGILDWLIPSETKRVMSSTDWLLTVLAIYLHDLGMLVTRKEYEERNSSGFPEFRDKDLFGGDKGKDYQVKVEKLGPDRAERFAYQEFVRAKHAERIRAWILGMDRERLGIAPEVVAELDKLLSSLTPQFRRDLAMVCESHHLNDLDDFRKYKISQPFGDSDDETANLQYAAILMRTADLLDLTSNRTPSVAYRLINPTDPISQEEWARQMAVRRLRSQIGRNKEGDPDEAAPRDTIEVHADFKNEEGFFGLSSYLQYAAAQLQRSNEWALEANKTQGARHRFPWRYIDSTGIETEGFIKEAFEFTLDQARILDLLTGHTLYNDIKIVLRELIQNSIDAVRLQQFINNNTPDANFVGKVEIHWDSGSRILSIKDNGTGMTQAIIERNLLKVGASRYQDEEFRTQYPDFSSISRFGIGILSTFMIADSVEIVTCHPDEERARQMSLRSVHGKYLIRLLDKYTDPVARDLSSHGTSIQLRVRHSVDMSDILQTAKRWIVVPRCEVSMTIDDNPPALIGFPSPEKAVESYLVGVGVLDDQVDAEEKTKIKIVERSENGVTLAYALKWSEYFREWSLLEPRQTGTDSEDEEILLGTCVEGVRVEFNTPGFNGYTIVALANAEGVNAPKTNVARSGLEGTAERDSMLSAIYSMFCKHINSEIEALHSRRSFSLTWAVQEAKYLVAPLLGDSRRQVRAINSGLLNHEIQKLPILLVEHDGQRRAVAPSNVHLEPVFWTIDCASFRSAETLIREMPTNASLTALVNALDSAGFQIPQEPLLCSAFRERGPTTFAYLGKEVVQLRVHREQRRVDLRWAATTAVPKWRTFPTHVNLRRIALRDATRRAVFNDILRINVGQESVEVTGIDDEIAVKAFSQIYLLPGSALAESLVVALNKLESKPESEELAYNTFYQFFIVSYILHGYISIPTTLRELQNQTAALGAFDFENPFTTEFLGIINSSNPRVFDPTKWLREGEG